MKRLEAFLKKKLEGIRVTNRRTRVESVLNVAKINAEEKESEAKLKLDDLGVELAETDNVQAIISQMSEQFNLIEEAKMELERIDKIKKFLYEEVEA